jgi:hypothetical protein
MCDGEKRQDTLKYMAGPMSCMADQAYISWLVVGHATIWERTPADEIANLAIQL